MKKKFPTIEVKSATGGKVFITWRDVKANRRYHIWFSRDQLDHVFYSNWIDPQGKSRGRTHKRLKASAKKWAPFMAHIRAVLAARQISEARAAFNLKHDSARAAAFKLLPRIPTAELRPY